MLLRLAAEAGGGSAVLGVQRTQVPAGEADRRRRVTAGETGRAMSWAGESGFLS